MRISVCKCLKRERELLSQCSQLKWITKPLQGIKMDMLFKRHYHPPVLLKQVLRFHTMSFHLLVKTLKLKKIHGLLIEGFTFTGKTHRKGNPHQGSSFLFQSDRTRKDRMGTGQESKPFMLRANTASSPFFWMEREMAYTTEAIPSIFSSNWFLLFCCNLSKTLKHVSFLYCVMGHRRTADCAKVSFRKVKITR